MDSTTTYPAPALYRRLLFQPRTGASDVTSTVLWMQGKRYYCDVRFTVLDDGRSSFQMGFAGPLNRHDTSGEVEWEHAIVAGAAFGSTDVGRLTQIPGWGLLETGRDLDYVELWEQERTDTGPVVEFAGTDAGGRAVLFIRVGDAFGLALAERVDDGLPASVNIGRRDGPEWVARHSAWASDPPPRFTITQHTDTMLGIAWRIGPIAYPPITFHSQESPAHD